MNNLFGLFSTKSPEPTLDNTEIKSSLPKKNVSSKKKPTLSVSAADESVDFSVHFKNKVLTIYLYINKKGMKESWKAKLNETEMNKLLYNLFLNFSNHEQYQEQLQSVYPNQQLEQVIHVNPNTPLSLDDSLAKIASLLNK